MRRDRPGSAATITGAAVATASETIDTLSIVTTIASASAEHAEIRVVAGAVPDIGRRAGAAGAASAATAAGSVRREGVTASPDPVGRIMPARLLRQRRGSGASSRKRPLLPPTSTATSGRGRSANRGAQACAAAASRAGVTRCSAVRVTNTFGPVSSSCRAATIRSKRRGSMRGCCMMTVRVAPRSVASTAAAMPPQPMTISGSGGASASGAIARCGQGHSVGVSTRKMPRGTSTRRSCDKPAASASPVACDQRPA